MPNLYNILLILSRNKFFYIKLKLTDTFQTRVYLMFLHFSVLMKIYKLKGKKFNQKMYDIFFNNIENDLRELGYGDITVNKKMKELNKILYDILLKIKINDSYSVKSVNTLAVLKYFDNLNKNTEKFDEFNLYFSKFLNFCFDISLENMVENAIKFKY